MVLRKESEVFLKKDRNKYLFVREDSLANKHYVLTDIATPDQYLYRGFKLHVYKEYTELLYAATSFYVLEALSLIEKPARRVDYTKFNAWQKDLLEFQEAFIAKCARSLRDCLASMALIEARHYPTKSSDQTPALTAYYGQLGDCKNTARYDMFKEIHRFHPEQTNQLIDYFKDLNWPPYYGGKSWAAICRKINLYGKISNKLYCDLVFNTVHNGGIAFDKEFIFHTDHIWPLKDFLNFRADIDDLLSFAWQDLPRAMQETVLPIRIDYDVFNLLLAACKLKVVDLFWYEDANDELLSFIENYIPTGKTNFIQVDWQNSEQIFFKAFESLEEKEA